MQGVYVLNAGGQKWRQNFLGFVGIDAAASTASKADKRVQQAFVQLSFSAHFFDCSAFKTIQPLNHGQ